jgi:hypothetical protein
LLPSADVQIASLGSKERAKTPVSQSQRIAVWLTRVMSELHLKACYFRDIFEQSGSIRPPSESSIGGFQEAATARDNLILL